MTTDRPPDSLEMMWAEVEALLPNNSGGIELHGRADLGYVAMVRTARVSGRGRYIGGNGDTHVAALRALADRLTERFR